MNASAKGRRAYERRAWADAFAAFSEAHDLDADADGVERLAWSAVLSGHEVASCDAFARLHKLRLEAGESLPAARAAFWLALRLASLGQHARAAPAAAPAKKASSAHGLSGWELEVLRLVARARQTRSSRSSCSSARRRSTATSRTSS
jgi:hypothetical protein